MHSVSTLGISQPLDHRKQYLLPSLNLWNVRPKSSINSEADEVTDTLDNLRDHIQCSELVLTLSFLDHEAYSLPVLFRGGSTSSDSTYRAMGDISWSVKPLSSY